MWEYSEKVLEHYRHPRNVGKIDNADLIGEAGSLACGDSLKLYIKLDGSVIKRCKISDFRLRFSCCLFKHFDRNDYWKNS